LEFSYESTDGEIVIRLELVSIKLRNRETPLAQVAEEFVERLAAYVSAELCVLPTEERAIQRAADGRRTRPLLILLDSRGKHLSSEELAEWIGRQRDSGAQHLIFAIGPADGWSAAARERADLLLSFGPMTFPHELARVMLAEQVYRAFTILAGHPYHSGH
jgi:23S rRNA (pseudouridine1915-N3)-methyltransferase